MKQLQQQHSVANWQTFTSPLQVIPISSSYYPAKTCTTCPDRPSCLMSLDSCPVCSVFGPSSKASSPASQILYLRRSVFALDWAGPLNSPEGVLKSVRIYNNNEQFLAAGPNDISIRSGDFVDIIMDQGVSQQAPYVQIRNGDGERTCIAYVTVTFNDGQNRGWDGTWAEQMPEPVQWYYSGVILDGSTAPGKCLWMNEDVGTLMIYMPAFAPGPDKSVNPDLNYYFGTAGFRAYKFNDRVGELALAPGWPSRKEKRGAVAAAAAQPQRKKKRAPDSRLVITDQPGHSAAELCGSHSSHGPSLVSLVEGLFCNMETREVLPICAGELTEGCFEVPDTKAVHGQSANASASAQAAGNSGILDWTIKARR